MYIYICIYIETQAYTHSQTCSKNGRRTELNHDLCACISLYMSGYIHIYIHLIMCWISQSERANSNNNVNVYFMLGVFESFSMGIELKNRITKNRIGILISSSSIKSYSRHLRFFFSILRRI